MRKKILFGIIGLLMLGTVGIASAEHQSLKGCQPDPNSGSYTVDVGTILGLDPLVEDLAACCIRGHYESPTDNGFPGGCCKHPWLEPGPPSTENPSPFPPLNAHPGERTDPREPPQVGHGCKCATIRIS